MVRLQGKRMSEIVSTLRQIIVIVLNFCLCLYVGFFALVTMHTTFIHCQRVSMPLNISKGHLFIPADIIMSSSSALLVCLCLSEN